MPEYSEDIRNRANKIMPHIFGHRRRRSKEIFEAICACLEEQPSIDFDPFATVQAEKKVQPKQLKQWQIDAAEKFVRDKPLPASLWNTEGIAILAEALFTPPPAEPEDARLPIWREFMAARFEVMGRKTRAIQYRDGSSDDEFPAWIARHDEARGAGL